MFKGEFNFFIQSTGEFYLYLWGFLTFSNDCQARRAAPTTPILSPILAIRNLRPFKWEAKQRVFSSFIMGLSKSGPAADTPPLKMITPGLRRWIAVVRP